MKVCYTSSGTRLSSDSAPRPSWQETNIADAVDQGANGVAIECALNQVSFPRVFLLLLADAGECSPGQGFAGDERKQWDGLIPLLPPSPRHKMSESPWLADRWLHPVVKT